MSIRSLAAQLPAADESPGWFAFRTMHKREKVAAKRLERQGVETYVPLRVVVKHYKSKTVTSSIPLLSTYVLCRLTRAEYGRVLADPDVFEAVSFDGELGRVSDGEVAFLRAVLAEGDADAYQVQQATSLRPGERVAIVGGALAGTQGEVVRDRGKHNFVVRLRNLGVAVELVVADHLLQRL